MKQRPGVITRFQRQFDDGSPIIIRGKVLTEEQYKKYEARWKAQTALNRGWIRRNTCYICGDAKTEKHHPDYDRPLYVIWLCRKHHLMVDWGNLSLLIKPEIPVSCTTSLTSSI